MANIFDYITWRGDLTLAQVPHNEIDLLILCRMSYLPLDDIVPASFSSTITVGQAMEGFLALPNPESRVYLPADVQLAQVLKDCHRFRSLPLCGYVNCLAKDRQEQFSATTVLLNPGKSFVVYRGTDNSLVGWKEDFNMGFMTPVPSQIDAVSYLEQAAQELEGTLIVGGHS